MQPKGKYTPAQLRKTEKNSDIESEGLKKILEQQEKFAKHIENQNNVYKPLETILKIETMLGTDSWKAFEADRKICLEGWQYVEPAWQSNENRYELDKEAYQKQYFDPAHLHEVQFNEKILLERLIKNLQAAKHPVYIEYRMFLENRLSNLKVTNSGQIASTSNVSQTLSDLKPTFKPEIVNQLYEILKDFFSPEQQAQLKLILQTGGNVNEKLLFKGNGNKLADAFKQLINTDLIAGCQKKELENWICVNFSYLHNKKIVSFKTRYLNDIISTTKDKCQNPLLNVKKNQITGQYVISKA